MKKCIIRRFTKFSKGKITSKQIYSDLDFSSLINAHNIIYLSKFNRIMDNIEPILKFFKYFLGDNLFFKLLGKTLGK